MSFQINHVMQGVYHVQDNMGVCMTLLVGDTKALLIDTGYGLEDVHAFVKSITDKPLQVILTHGHHDHAMGASWFRSVYLFPEDFPVYQQYTQLSRRETVLRSAIEKGIDVSEETFLTATMPTPLPLQCGSIDLGGFTVEVIQCPGHTPGSAVVYLPERRLLLTGDDWNPCTWLFFPEAIPVQEWKKNMGALLSLPFSHVLCAHQPTLYGRRVLEDYLQQLNDQAFLHAAPVAMGGWEHIRTAQWRMGDNEVLVFDYDKYLQHSRER